MLYCTIHLASEPQFRLLTSVDDCFPRVEFASVWDGIKMTTLDVSEAGQLLRTRCGVTDLVPPALSQTIPPSVLGTAGG